MSQPLLDSLFGRNRGLVNITITRPDGTIYTARFSGRAAVIKCMTFLIKSFPEDLREAGRMWRRLVAAFGAGVDDADQQNTTATAETPDDLIQAFRRASEPPTQPLPTIRHDDGLSLSEVVDKARRNKEDGSDGSPE